jgi:hypothetical protein
MLGTGCRFQVAWVIPLHPVHELHADPGGEAGVFAVGFLPTPPARVTKDIDIRRPEGQPGEAGMVTIPQRFVVFGPALIGDRGGHSEDQFLIPGGSDPDRLGKDCRFPGPGDAV